MSHIGYRRNEIFIHGIHFFFPISTLIGAMPLLAALKTMFFLLIVLVFGIWAIFLELFVDIGVIFLELLVNVYDINFCFRIRKIISMSIPKIFFNA
jgi:hypothetical protein